MNGETGSVIETVPYRGIGDPHEEDRQLKRHACSQGAGEDTAVP